MIRGGEPFFMIREGEPLYLMVRVFCFNHKGGYYFWHDQGRVSFLNIIERKLFGYDQGKKTLFSISRERSLLSMIRGGGPFVP